MKKTTLGDAGFLQFLRVNYPVNSDLKSSFVNRNLPSSVHFLMLVSMLVVMLCHVAYRMVIPKPGHILPQVPHETMVLVGYYFGLRSNHAVRLIVYLVIYADVSFPSPGFFPDFSH